MRDHKELNWFASGIEELEQYRGKHIAILGHEVVASGLSASDVFEQAKMKFPDKKPVLAYVPKDETLILQKGMT